MSGADARDGKGSDAGEQADGAADEAAGGGSGGRAFGGFGVFFVGEGAGGFVVGQQNGDVGVGETGEEQVVDGAFGLEGGGVDAEDGDVAADFGFHH